MRGGDPPRVFPRAFRGGEGGSAVTRAVCTRETPGPPWGNPRPPSWGNPRPPLGRPQTPTLLSEYQKDFRMLVMTKEMQRDAQTRTPFRHEFLCDQVETYE